MPNLNDPIQLNLQLFDGSTSKYVRAYLYDASNALIATVSLPHLALGLYRSATQMMPNSSRIAAVYRVFDDAGFTTPSSGYSQSLDVFKLAGAVGIVSAGQLIQTDLLLFDGDTTKYPLVKFYNAGTLVSTLPLSHVGHGLYTEATQVMPATTSMEAVIKVYNDSGHTTESSLHAEAMDVNTSESVATVIYALSQQILLGSGPKAGTLIG